MKTVWIKQGFGGLMTPDADNSPDWVVGDLDEVCTRYTVKGE